MSTMLDDTTGEKEAGSTLVKNRAALWLLLLVLVAIGAATWMLTQSQQHSPNLPPPLAPFLLAGLAAGTLFWGHRRYLVTQASRAASDRETTAREPFSLWEVLGISGLPQGVTPWQVLTFLGALVLMLIVLAVIPRLADTDNYFFVFLAWLASMLLYLAAVAPPGQLQVGTWSTRLQAAWHRHRIVLLLVVGILIVAALVRVVSIGTLPHTLGGDEGSQGLEAIRVIEREIRNPFTTGWLGVPTMSFFFNSISLRLFGMTNEALRLPWALVGVATVLVSFLLVRRLTNLPVALLTSALMAVYHYHIHYSRLGSNQVADPLFVALSLWFLYRALDEKRPFDWAMSGIVAALALYFYAGARFTPILLAAVLVFTAMRQPRRFQEEHVSGVAVLIGAFLLVGAPMLQYAVRFPDDFNARLNQVGIIQSGWLANEVAVTGKSQVEILFDQFRRAVLAYNYYPDRTVWYGLRQPLLDPFFGIVFLVGLLYGSLRIFGGTRGQRLAPMVFWWFGGMVMGGMLTESPPSTQRLITTSVPVCFFVALALWELVRLAEAAVNGIPRRPILVLALVTFAVISLRTYFVDYSPQRVYGGPHAELATDLAPILNELDQTHYAYFLGAPWMYWGFATIPYMAPDIPGEDIRDPLQAPPPPELLLAGRGGVFVFLPQRENELALVQQTFPNGQVVELHAEAPDGRLMAKLYVVPPRTP